MEQDTLNKNNSSSNILPASAYSIPDPTATALKLPETYAKTMQNKLNAAQGDTFAWSPDQAKQAANISGARDTTTAQRTYKVQQLASVEGVRAQANSLKQQITSLDTELSTLRSALSSTQAQVSQARADYEARKRAAEEARRRAAEEAAKVVASPAASNMPPPITIPSVQYQTQFLVGGGPNNREDPAITAAREQQVAYSRAMLMAISESNSSLGTPETRAAARDEANRIHEAWMASQHAYGSLL